MRKKTVFKLMTLLVLAAALCLCGCAGKSGDPEKTTFRLRSDGSVVHTIIESGSQTIDQEELKAYIEENISEFLEANPKASVKLQECTVREDKIRIEISYDSVEDYAAFNDVTCFCGKVNQAYTLGYGYSMDFTAMNGLSFPGYVLPVQYPDYNLLVVQEAMNVEVPGDIAAVTGNAQITSENMAEVAPMTDTTLPEVFQTVNMGNTYIVYCE